MQPQKIAKTTILDVTSYELKLLLRGIILSASLVLFFVYMIIMIIDVDKTGYYNSLPTSFILSVGTLIAIKLLLHTKLEKLEIRRFRFVFLALFCYLIGELIYLYYQVFLGIVVPYPSIGDLFYLSATGFLSFHLYHILHLKKRLLKNKAYLYLGLIGSSFPIYLLMDTIYNHQSYYSDSSIELIINASYYASDVIVIFPCIPIILSLKKKDPFIFHWLLVSLSILVLVSGDLFYTFLASINEELLTITDWLWAFVYAIGYLLLSASILWFSKLKAILEYERYSKNLESEQYDSLNEIQDRENTIFLLDVNDILRNLINLIENSKERIDILFVEVIEKDDIIRFLEILKDTKRIKKSVNIRILLPYSKLDKEIIFRRSNKLISIKHFDRPLATNTITAIIDSEIMYMLGVGTNDYQNKNKFFIKQTTNKMKIYAFDALFEKIWFLEKSIDFGG